MSIKDSGQAQAAIARMNQEQEKGVTIPGWSDDSGPRL